MLFAKSHMVESLSISFLVLFLGNELSDSSPRVALSHRVALSQFVLSVLTRKAEKPHELPRQSLWPFG